MAQKRAMSLTGNNWYGQWGDPSVIPPNSVYNMSTAGVLVNERSVLSLTVVAACIRVLGDVISNLDVRVYRQTGQRPNPAVDEEIPLPRVIGHPYGDMDREDGDFRRVGSLALGGNIFEHIVDRDPRGLPTQVELMNPAIIRVEMELGAKVYRIGAVGSIIPNPDVIHVPWLALPGGLVGLNPIEIGAVTFGIPIAASEYAARYFGQGMHPTGILSVEKPLTPQDAQRLQQEMFVRHGGLAQSHTPIVLDANAKWQQISITPETAQLLQTRAFSRGEIAGFYGVPAHLVGGETSDSGGGGVWGKGLQEMSMQFGLYTLRGYARRLDRADTRLLPPGYYVRRNIADLYHSNHQALGEYLNALRMSSVATPNEARELAGLPPVAEPGASSIFAPINSAHNDWLALQGTGSEMGLPGGLQPKGQPAAGSDPEQIPTPAPPTKPAP